jgi:S-adenosyl-L-methionine hydrolase (adenosine-forming)
VNTISFLTDYGHADEFVGVCKSVIRQLAPETVVIDLTHDLPAHDVRAGSLALVRSIQYLADGVVLAIVDPGVGTARKAVAVEAGERGEYVFVGPDNGLLAPAVAMLGGARRAVNLTNEEHHLAAPGATFAGRDIFAPVAARLSTGMPITAFGDTIDPASLLPGVLPLSRTEDGRVLGEALWVDRFGNVQLNIDPDDVAAIGEVVSLSWGSTTRTVHRADSYGAIKAGEIGLVVDSYGLLSVCLDRQNASRSLGLGAGSAVTLTAPE